LYLPEAADAATLLLGLGATLAFWGYAVWGRLPYRPHQRERTADKAWQLSGVYALVFVMCDLLALPCSPCIAATPG